MRIGVEEPTIPLDRLRMRKMSIGIKIRLGGKIGEG